MRSMRTTCALGLLLAGQPSAGSQEPAPSRLRARVAAQGLADEAATVADGLATELEAARAARPAALAEILLRAPLAASDAARAATDALLEAGRQRALAPLLARCGAWCGGPGTPAADDAAPALGGLDLEALGAHVVAVLEAAAADVEAAFAGLTPDERRILDGALGALCEDLRGTLYVHERPGHAMTWELAQRVDRARLLRAAERLSTLADPRLARELRRALRAERPPRPDAPPGVHGNVLWARETPLGWALVGGAADNAYDLPVAFVLDLGGDDRYSGAATSSAFEHPVNVVVDLAGDDAYTADEHAGGQGFGHMGVSLLFDEEGRDRYVAGSHAQGSARCGVGVLVDRAGDDEYQAEAFAQGAAIYGLGVLLDARGDDVLLARQYAQGFAGPLSVGLLLDGAGADRRGCSGASPSSYGRGDAPSAFAQGCGVGFRGGSGAASLAAGGVGVLLDGGGDDVTECGEFGYGVGVYLGVGIARDTGGDDRVRVDAYGLALGAHLGSAVVLDDDGADHFDLVGMQGLAAAWDLGVAAFVDERGDDRYQAAQRALGSAAVGSLACFLDAAGADGYAAEASSSLAGAGDAQDAERGRRSFAAFCDLGGAQDAYPADAQAGNGRTLVRVAAGEDESATPAGTGLCVDE